MAKNANSVAQSASSAPMWVAYILVNLVVFGIFTVPEMLRVYWFEPQWFQSVSLSYLGSFYAQWDAQLGLTLALFIAFSVSALLPYFVLTRVVDNDADNVRWFHTAYGAVAALMVALALGWLNSSGFQHLYMNFKAYSPAGTYDSILGWDTNLYTFALPYYRAVSTVMGVWLGSAFLMTGLHFLVASLFSAHQTETIRAASWRDEDEEKVSSVVISTYTLMVSILIALLFVIIAWGNSYVANPSYVVDSNGLFNGAGIKAVSGAIPFDNVMNVVLVMCAIGTLGLGVLQTKTGRLPFWYVSFPAVALMLVSIIGWAIVEGWYYFGIVNQAKQYSANQPYIAANLDTTRKACGIDEIAEEPFVIAPTTGQAGFNTVMGDDAVKQLRVWDTLTAQQYADSRQAPQVFYSIPDMEPNRLYTPEGLYPIMGGLREMDSGLVPSKGAEDQWLKTHFTYTHGYGLVVLSSSAIEQVGQYPSVLLGEIPQQMRSASGAKNLVEPKNPRVYYGLVASPWIGIYGQDEFDQLDKVYRMEKPAGVTLGSGLDRQFVSWSVDGGFLYGYFSTLNRSTYPPSTQILLRRSLPERLSMIVPFLEQSQYPHAVTDDKGNLMVVGYLYTNATVPYAQYGVKRLAVIAVQNTLTGQLDLYQYANDDPVMNAWAKKFPGMFKPLSQMDLSVVKQLRYPDELSRWRRDCNAVYHVKDALSLYNSDRVWSVGREKNGIEDQGVGANIVTSDVYYQVMKLPGDERATYQSVGTYTPNGGNNIIGFVTFSSESDSFGKMRVFTIPADPQRFGALDFETSIDTTFQQYLSLLEYGPAKVIRSNTYILPIGHDGGWDLLYAEAIFTVGDANATQNQSTTPNFVGWFVYPQRVPLVKPAFGYTLSQALRVAYGVEEVTVLPPTPDNQTNLLQLPGTPAVTETAPTAPSAGAQPVNPANNAVPAGSDQCAELKTKLLAAINNGDIAENLNLSAQWIKLGCNK